MESNNFSNPFLSIGINRLYYGVSDQREKKNDLSRNDTFVLVQLYVTDTADAMKKRRADALRRVMATQTLSVAT